MKGLIPRIFMIPVKLDFMIAGLVFSDELFRLAAFCKPGSGATLLILALSP